MAAAIRRLVLRMGVPASASVRVTLALTGDEASFRRRLSSGATRSRHLQSITPSAVANIAIDLNDTAPASASVSAASSIAAASNLATTVTSQLASNTNNLAAAVQTAIIETDATASDVNITVPQAPVFAVMAASDGAVLAASASVIDAIRPTPSPTPGTLPTPTSSAGGSNSVAALDLGAIAGAIGGGLAALVVFFVGAAVCRRFGMLQRRKIDVMGSPDGSKAPETASKNG